MYRIVFKRGWFGNNAFLYKKSRFIIFPYWKRINQVRGMSFSDKEDSYIMSAAEAWLENLKEEKVELKYDGKSA